MKRRAAQILVSSLFLLAFTVPIVCGTVAATIGCCENRTTSMSIPDQISEDPGNGGTPGFIDGDSHLLTVIGLDDPGNGGTPGWNGG